MTTLADIALTKADWLTLKQILVGRSEAPDLIIAPTGEPYLYRWHLAPRSAAGNVYLHYQVADDQERAQHDHPWDNTSVILSGGYIEYMGASAFFRRPGEIIHRWAEQAHRLEMGTNEGGTITVFITGPKRRDWGFHTAKGWVAFEDVVKMDPETRTSTMKGEL